MDQRRASLAQLGVFALCLGFGAALSVALGQDISWDTKNYHLYNAWAFLHGRGAQDITAAGMQSYFNPLADLPYLALAQGPLHAWPRTLAALQGLWFGALVFLVLKIAKHLAQRQGRRFGMVDVCAALIGVTGSMAVSQAGSTTNEIQLAVLMLLGIYALMPLLAPSAVRQPGLRAWLAGLCCGLAAGLKPTAAVYPPAMALSLLITMGIGSRLAWKATTLYAMGVALAFLATYGAWGWHLYQSTGNPLFPLFNQIFQSPLTAMAGGTDGRFRPHDLAHWLFYPFFWIKRQQWLVTEAPFADPRYAVAMLALAALLVARWKARDDRAQGSHAAASFLAIFFFVGYVLWLVLFSILRYAIPLEALTGLLLLAGFHAWKPDTWRVPTRGASLSMTALLLLVLGTTSYPNWWRGGYARHVFEVEAPTIEPNSLVILAGSPDAYLAPMLGDTPGVSFVGLTWFTAASRGYGLWDITRQRLGSHVGPMYVVRRDDPENANELALLRELLPQRHATDCQAIRSNLETGRRGKSYAAGLSLCRLTAN
ncbi:hypothetical protein P5Y53_20015 [Dyella jiangningensis]|uniref:hypothetical protein n=1 Tax=Dyella jiangningensis TaxID=1379159 RepID=UPI00240F457D|nr:hypothetical protein [Dyella jiangningensis]MDG2539972.1 hypothetical protein [Dyella jiangningensis]